MWRSHCCPSVPASWRECDRSSLSRLALPLICAKRTVDAALHELYTRDRLLFEPLLGPGLDGCRC